MRYKIRGIEIRTENAAKPRSHRSKYLCDFLSSMNKVESILDYGTGKLRYAELLMNKCNKLTLVDSKIQLERTQSICGKRTTVIEYVKNNMNNTRAISLEEFTEDNELYDFVLCSNVLSAIPDAKVRAQMLRNILDSIHIDSRCLFVTQFRNTYFNNYIRSENSIKHLDGTIFTGKQGSSYYGLLDSKKISTILTKRGFNIIDSWHIKESAYVYAGIIA